MFVLCLVLRSAFDYKQSHILISSAERANSNSILKSVLGNKVYDFVSQKAKKHIPRLMVYYDDHIPGGRASLREPRVGTGLSLACHYRFVRCARWPLWTASLPGRPQQPTCTSEDPISPPSYRFPGGTSFTARAARGHRPELSMSLSAALVTLSRRCRR